MRRLGLFALAALLLGAAALRDAADRWIGATELPGLVTDSSVEVRARDGRVLRAYTVADGLWRLAVRPDQIDARFTDMLVAYEDKRFWHHAGVDPWALLRAALQSAGAGRVVSGGSTLTMQVARLLEDSGTGRWEGKLRQIRLALALERHLSKNEILQLYLLNAPYGGNLEGLRAATRAYFGKDPGRLTPAQAALMVALPQAPEARRPDRDPNMARAARDRVLLRAGATGIIGPETLAVAMAEPVPSRRRAFPSYAPHMANRALRDRPDAGRHDLTLSFDLQVALEALAEHVVRGRGERLSVAMVVANHRSGDILASVGSARFADAERQGFIDMTQARRSPGSTLKPLVYALAFDAGLVHPETLIDDRPVAFGTYAPQNFDGAFRGELRVSEALRQSLNIPVVLLTEELGPTRLLDALRRAGLSPALPGGKPGLALALGGVGVTLTELVTLYAGQANGGIARPLSWRKDAPRAAGSRFVARSAAWQVGHILSGVTPPPGAPRNRLAYKTGTSYGHRDAWAIGFDGTHVAGVWIGRPDGTPVPGAFGGALAAPVLFELFQRLKPALDPLPPPPPETLLVTTARLPQPLQRFRGRHALFETAADAPKLAFPPDGARLLPDPQGLTIKIRDGAVPYSVLANGRVLMTGVHDREVTLSFGEPGYSELTVIDAKGRSDRVRIRIE